MLLRLTPGRSLPHGIFDAAVTVLRELCASPAFAGLVLTEVNPTHDPGGELLGRYLDGVVAALGAPARGR